MKPEATMYDWNVIPVGANYQLHGKVRGHSVIQDGHSVVTSILERIDFVRGIAETRNTIYRLK